MDGSLASIFFSTPPAQQLDGNDGARNERSALDARCPDGLRYQLMCACMELQRARTAAEDEGKIHEAKLYHLQELLATIKKERDEARDECKKLRERLSHQGSLIVDSPCSFIDSSPVVSSPMSSPWSLQELEEHLNSDTFGNLGKVPPALELQQTLQSFSANCNEEHGFEDLFAGSPACDSMLENSEPAFSLDALEYGPPFDTDSNTKMPDAELRKEVVHLVSGSAQSTRSLSRQSSSNSSSASVQMLQYPHSPNDLTDVVGPDLAQVGVEFVGVAMEKYMAPASSDNVSFPVAPSLFGKAMASTGDLGIHPSMDGEAVTTMVPTQQQCNPRSPPNTSLECKPANASVLRQLHLPEPPESDPEVMLSSLPEKGKLLQAVMQAGPLLQTLLLAGPLPQWRHPPPALSTGDIPKVSMLPSSNLIFPHPRALVAQGQIKYQTPAPNRDSSPASKSRAANMDSCARPKKLRKLSPVSPHQSQLLHMWAGDGVLPAGGISYPPTIY